MYVSVCMYLCVWLNVSITNNQLICLTFYQKNKREKKEKS